MEKPHVIVGLSGGVDSSVAAALLLRAGYRVTGAFIRAWYPDFLPCTWREERLDAMRVAAALGIPFVTIDLEAEYKEHVVDYFVREYAAGQTPNPDVMCNREIKFGAFFSRARALGADMIATGHYARTEKAGGRTHLVRGADREKDQSYFLWAVPEAVLARTFFPVGGYEKRDVRRLAEKFSLPTAAKKDSQGLCFLGHIDVKDFLSHYVHIEPGIVRNELGNIIGEHDGALLYTLGQRHGFRVSASGAVKVPHYVIGKDMGKNEIIVGTTATPAVAGRGALSASEANWIGEPPKVGDKVTCAIRYRDRGHSSTLAAVAADSFSVLLDEPTLVAPGQSLVLYDGARCLGGGVVTFVPNTL